MRRATFLAGGASCAALLALPALPAFAAARTTLDRLTAPYASPASRTWVEYVLGASDPYLKKIGYGVERTSLGHLPFIETQIGSTETACNPNTIKKAYLTHGGYGGLLQPHDPSLYVVKAGTAFAVAPSDGERLWLLDADNLYTAQPGAIVSDARDTFRLRKRTFETRRIEIAFAHGGAQSLATMTLWLTPAVPLGVARLRATLHGDAPFELRLDAFGDGYFSLVPESLDRLRQEQAG
jgi:hypothetical protein